MAKILIFSDLHIHPHKRQTDRLDDCLEALEWIFQTAIDRNIETIVCAGDLFHDRQKIDVLTYQKTFELFEKYLCNPAKAGPPFSIHLLLGNHDMFHYQRWDVTAVTPLRRLPGVSIIDRPCKFKLFPNGDEHEDIEVGFLPYTKDPIDDLKSIEQPDGHKVMFAHIAVDNALWNVRAQTRAEVSVEHDGDMVKVSDDIFKDWDQTFLGHYHAQQKLDHNVEYIGSPLQLDFGEAFQHKHIIIYDTETHEKEYIRNTFSPQHFIIPSEDVSKYDLNKNFIRIEVSADMLETEVIDLRRSIVEGTSPTTLEIIPSKKVKDEGHIIDDAKAILFKQDEMVQHYIDEVEKNQGLEELKKDSLIAVGEEIIHSDEDK